MTRLDRIANKIPFERLSQRVRYLNWWPLHPIQYHRSEQLRRATNLVAKVALEFNEDLPRKVRCGMGCDIPGYWMTVEMEPIEDDKGSL